MIYKYVGINAVNQMLLTKKGAWPRQAKACKLGLANLASKAKTLKQVQPFLEKEVDQS